MSDDAHDTAPESAPESAPTGEGTTLAELLETPISRSEPDPAPAPTCVMGEVLDTRHPTLRGRILVRFALRAGPGPDIERWVPTLQGMPVRVQDRVMMNKPANADEWVATGVIDGFADRPQLPKSEAARVELQRDEALSVVSRDGAKLVEISQGESGPVVRVLEPDVKVEFAGKLALEAEDIELRATKGEVALQASADVVLKGETIQLN